MYNYIINYDHTYDMYYKHFMNTVKLLFIYFCLHINYPSRLYIHNNMQHIPNDKYYHVNGEQLTNLFRTNYRPPHLKYH